MMMSSCCLDIIMIGLDRILIDLNLAMAVIHLRPKNPKKL